MANKNKKEAPVEVLDDDQEVPTADENEKTDGPAESREDLLSQIEELKEQARESSDKMLRLAAEFDNSKKRMQRDYEGTLKYAEENLLRDFLPFIDNLERALNLGRETDDSASLLEGVELTLKNLLSALEKYGLKPVSGRGAQFDPNFHEALAMEESSEVPENSILQEYEKGYMFKDRLLRAAKVVVAKRISEAP